MTGTDDKTRAVAPAGAAAEAAGPGGAPVRLFDAARLGKLVVCIAGIYVFFVLWAVLQERVSSEEYTNDDGLKFRFTAITLLNLVQAVCAGLVAYVALKVQGLGDCGTPTKAYIKAAISNTLASPCGYASIPYTSYLFLAIGKSCKLVPVLGFNFVMNRTPLTKLQVAAVTLISGGIVVFKVYDSHDYHAGTAWATFVGSALVVANLCFDGYTSATQDGIVKAGAARARAMAASKGETASPGDNTVSAFHLMYHVNFWAVWILVVWFAVDAVVADNSELEQTRFLMTHFPQALIDVAWFSLLGAIGQLFIFYSISEFGTLVTTTICITRKFWSILLSVMRSPRPIEVFQWVGIIAVFSGLGLEIYEKYSKQMAAKQRAKLAATKKDA